MVMYAVLALIVLAVIATILGTAELRKTHHREHTHLDLK